MTALVRRPELGALAGTAFVYLLFVLTAGEVFYRPSGMGTWLTQAAELGILAVPVAMLMIAGEFDLSIGSMLGAASMIIAIAVGSFGWPIWLALALAFVIAVCVGAFNGYVIVRTGLPSFIVTLAALFILRGLTIGVARVLTSSTHVSLGGAQEGSLVTAALASRYGSFSVSILWWLGLVVLGTVVLTRTRFGNWIYGTGGDRESARKAGVKVDRVRIMLFIATACAATLVGVSQVLLGGSGDVLRGELREFEVIIAVVIGGCLLTGGYGTVIGGAFGALTFGIASLGIFYAGWDTDWFKALLGVMLLVAVLANNFIRNKALESR